VTTRECNRDKRSFFIAFLRDDIDVTEVITATGLPLDKIVIVSPFLTSRNKLEKPRFAFAAVIVFIPTPFTNKVGYRTTLFRLTIIVNRFSIFSTWFLPWYLPENCDLLGLMKIIISALLFCLILPISSLAAQPVDNRIWAVLLERHVTNHRVDYDGFKQDEALLDKYLAILSATDPSDLSRNHQFAFYINAYNAFTIKLVLTRYPGINSIKEIGSFFTNPWNKKFIPLKGFTVSLDHIEHDVLRPRFKDARVHFAINCASKGCPPLRNEPYDGTILETQLDDQASRFINHSKNTFLKDDTLFVSPIFKWFEDDFSGSPLQFIRQYAHGRLKQDLDQAKGNIRLQFLDYDWTLNR
jgi:hypothetical protein